MLACRLPVFVATFLLLFANSARAVEATSPELRALYSDKIQPLVATFCHSCHGKNEPQGKLDLTLFASIDRVADGHEVWQAVLERLEAKEMPPDDAKRQPTDTERQTLIDWIRAFHADQVTRNAGDPGVVPARRLNAAEYNYTIRDLIGFDIQPAKQFPIDPANEAGFDNSSQSLTMSPGLAKKYVEAARFVAEHLVLKPEGFDFAPHPVMTDTDRDKYCVNRIVDFYQRQPTDLAVYFLGAWKFQHRAVLGQPNATLTEIAETEDISPKYLDMLWSVLSEESSDVGPMAMLQKMWSELPANEMEKTRAGCVAIRDWVKSLRRKLEPSVKGLKVPGVHEGSQSFVLWKNRQYAANRRTYSKSALQTNTADKPAEDSNLAVPADETERARYEASFARFCDLFPDAFYISERGRDYVGKAREQQEKGRLLSAGFHSQMGYFRDDQPLCDLILSEDKKAELDKLWQELDFIANVPLRQLQGFLWFERTDSRFMRDPEFDPFRAEDKNATSGDKIARLAEVYLAKARANDGDEVELQAIADYFREMDERSRRVEQARTAAENSHLQRLIAYAQLAYRRPLTEAESDDLFAFYRSLRADGDVTHEEAIQDTLVYILMSPQFCYRMDLSSGWHEHPARAPEDFNAKTRPLTDYELASRLSYFLWSSMPDAELLNHAAAGDLHEPKILAAQVRRMLANDRTRALAVEFGGNWLDFRRFEQHNSVDRGRFPTFTNELRQAMYEEPIRFFVDLIQRDGSVLEFLYAKHTFVNGVLAEHYDLPDSLLGKDEWTRIDDAAEHGRGGLLPMAVFLTQNAPGLRTSPVKRGYWVVRRILGERIPAPPPNVPELPADESKLELSLRETLAKHRDHAACAGCHERFDSLGLVFEGYGPIGERRHTDLAGRPIDTQAVFPRPTSSAGSKLAPGATPGKSEASAKGGTGILPVSAPEPIEKATPPGLPSLLAYLRTDRQQEFLENLSRKLLSYALGRTLLPSDDPLVAQMKKNLAANDHRFTTLLETIVTSPQFLTKRQ